MSDKKTFEKRICELDGCDVEFEPQAANAKYCCLAHANTAARRRRNAATGPATRPTAPPKTIPTGEISDEEALRQENRELRTAARRVRKGEVERERLTSAIEDAVSKIAPPPRLPAVRKAAITGGEPHHRQLVVLSDWHGGEFVDEDAVNGLNSFSWSIMEERVDEVVTGLLSHAEHSPRLSGIDVVFVGDMCSGHHVEEIANTNELPIAEQGVKIGYLMGRTVDQLASHYENVRCLSVVGNHPRLQTKPMAKRVHDNMDWVAARIAKEYVSSLPTVSFEVPTSAAAFWTIAGHTFYVWHGDGIKTSMPGVPWGGVMRRVNEIRRAHANRHHIDGFILGHFHQCNVMRDLGIFMNGALKGTDEWTLKNFGGGSPPCQLILTFDEDRQRLTDARFLTPTAGLS